MAKNITKKGTNDVLARKQELAYIKWAFTEKTMNGRYEHLICYLKKYIPELGKQKLMYIFYIIKTSRELGLISISKNINYYTFRTAFRNHFGLNKTPKTPKKVENQKTK